MTIRPAAAAIRSSSTPALTQSPAANARSPGQVKGKREAERLEAKLRAEVADGRHRGTSGGCRGGALRALTVAMGAAWRCGYALRWRVRDAPSARAASLASSAALPVPTERHRDRGR